MGYYLIKPKKNDDFYVQWSSYEEKPVAYGTWQEFVNEDPETNNERRFARLEEYGTSAYLRNGGWATTHFIVYNMTKDGSLRKLKRTKLKDFVIAAFEADEDEDALGQAFEKYTKPFRWED